MFLFSGVIKLYMKNLGSPPERRLSLKPAHWGLWRPVLLQELTLDVVEL